MAEKTPKKDAEGSSYSAKNITILEGLEAVSDLERHSRRLE